MSEVGPEVIKIGELDGLKRRRSPPPLWFSWRKLPALYLKDKERRANRALMEVVLKVLMYSTPTGHHSSLPALLELFDHDSLEELAVVLLSEWMDGPQSDVTMWALHALSVMGGERTCRLLYARLIDPEGSAQFFEEERLIVALLDVFVMSGIAGGVCLDAAMEAFPDREVVLEAARTRWQYEMVAGIRTAAQLRKSLASIIEELRAMASAQDDEVEVDWYTARYRDALDERLRFLLERSYQEHHAWTPPLWRAMFVEDTFICEKFEGLIWMQQQPERGRCVSFSVHRDGAILDVGMEEVTDLLEDAPILLAHPALISAKQFMEWGEWLAEFQSISPIDQAQELSVDVSGMKLSRALAFLDQGLMGRDITSEMFLATHWDPYPRESWYGVSCWTKGVYVHGEKKYLMCEVNQAQVVKQAVFENYQDIGQRKWKALPPGSFDEVTARIIAYHFMELLDNYRVMRV